MNQQVSLKTMYTWTYFVDREYAQWQAVFMCREYMMLFCILKDSSLKMLLELAIYSDQTDVVIIGSDPRSLTC